MPGFELIGKEELEQIQALFKQQPTNLYRYGAGNFTVREFEQQFADHFGVKYAHAVSSGTAAIHCALAGIGVGPGDEVITTAFTFVAPVEAIFHLGATPIPVEIDETYHLDPASVKNAITPRTKAIVSVPMWASPKMDEIVDLCEEHDIALVEDAAQCLGGTFQGRKLGTFGSVGSFSFDMGKTLTVGEGGIVITDEKEIYDRVAEFSDHGHMHLPDTPRGQDSRRTPGLNLRMSEVTGAIGIAQLGKLDHIIEKSRANKAKVKNGINAQKITFRAFVDEAGALGDTLIFSLPDQKKAADVAQYLAAKGFGSKILPEALDWHFAGAWTHLLKRAQKENQDSRLIPEWPKTLDLLKRSVALPIFVKMEDSQMEAMAEAINEAAGSVVG